MSDFLNFKALERPKSPNTYLVAPAGFADQAKPDEAGPVFDCSPESLFGRVEALIGMRKDWRLESLDAQAGRIYFIAVSKLFRFKDDVNIAVLPAEGKSTLAIYSASRIGHSDLGANRKRVHELLSSLQVT
ncbi:MAG TPA: hypothetical protein DCG65_01110 [Hyphomonas atlantica]|uniref:DUF1499 domain-containing protein n=1 Tax=Hyphomonas atlantica TaxID=1280948 RepID=A0A3B9KWY0_9PROT|nr:hypothetical protein [Hyphomonas atlantica]